MRLIEDGPGIARGSDGKPLISPELYLVVDGIKRSTKTKANLPLRGIGEQGSTLRKGIAITAGRMFSRGSNEIVVGKALLREFEGFDLGSNVAFGATRWTVVGVFDAGGSVFESEIWADLHGGAEPVQPQQRRADRARAPHRPGGARTSSRATATTIRA